MPTPRTVVVTLVVTVHDPRKLRQEVIRRSGLPASEFREYGPAELAQMILDDSFRLRLDEAGMEIKSSESEDA